MWRGLLTSLVLMILTGCRNAQVPEGGGLTQQGQDSASPDCPESQESVWYLDEDGDGYGSTVAPTLSDCEAPSGYTARDGDCEDTLPAIHPGADEICDGLDNDCDGQVDNDPVDGERYWRDADGDGYGDPEVSALGCGPLDGWVDNPDDPDDSEDSSLHLLRGDWPTLGGSVSRQGYFRGTIDGREPRLLWTATQEDRQTAVAVQDGVVFLSIGPLWPVDTRVLALDAETGRQIWSRPLASAHALNPPTVADGRVLVQRVNNNDDTQLIALDEQTGELLWSAPHGAQGYRYLAPASADGKVWVTGGMHGGMLGFDAETGERLFFWEPLLAREGSPSYADGVLYSWVWGTFRAHDPATGEKRWSLPIGEDAWDTGPTSPVLVEGHGVVLDDRGLFVVDLSTGQLHWQLEELGFYGVPAVANGVVYAVNQQHVKAFDMDTGEPVATYSLPDPWMNNGERDFGHLVVTDDTLIRCTQEETSLFDLESGERFAVLPHGGWPALSDGRLFIAGELGELAVYEWTAD